MTERVHPSVLDDFDRRMLEFMVLWEPYGGPPRDEIYPRFGLWPDAWFLRVRQVALHALYLHPSPEDAVLCRYVLNSAVVQ